LILQQQHENANGLVHIPKFRNGAEKILANASTPDFFGASDIILGYALNYWVCLCQSRVLLVAFLYVFWIDIVELSDYSLVIRRYSTYAIGGQILTYA
jgi:hypothetical protein